MKKVNTLTRKKTKAQLTIFIILGLLIIMVCALTYVILYKTARQKLEPQTEEIIEKGLKKATFQFIVEECAKDTLKQGLKLIGEHGAYLPPDLPGAGTPFYGLDYQGSNISYLIYAKSFPPPVEYPLPIYKKGMKAYFGTNRLPIIRKIEQALETYTAEMMKQCVDFESGEWAGLLAGYDITQGDISADITITRDKISAQIDYPLIISPGQGEAMLLKKYKITLQPFPFERFHDILAEALDKETTNEQFNLTEALNDEGIEVDRTNIIEDGQYKGDYILRLTTPGLKLDNEYYLFQFAVKNRPPVLYYVDNIKDTDIEDVDACDPDDDKITIQKPTENQIVIYDEWNKNDWQIE